jgi:hypothetical protein
MSLDAMKQALEALERGETKLRYEAITTLRAAIEQAQEPVAWYFVRDLEKGISFAPDNDATKSWQPLYPALPAATEPVAWMVYTLDGKSVCVTDNPADFTDQHKALPLYTAPRQWQGLTEEEIKEIIGPWGETPIKGYTRKLFDQIEAKLREKNT